MDDRFLTGVPAIAEHLGISEDDVRHGIATHALFTTTRGGQLTTSALDCSSWAASIVEKRACNRLADSLALGKS